MSDPANEAVEFGNGAVQVQVGDDFVAEVLLSRPPNNFFSLDLIGGVADALAHLDADDRCRAAVLRAEGKHFCAGADFQGDRSYTSEDLYAAAVRIFRTQTPVVAAIQGAAIGGGLGLALSADLLQAVSHAMAREIAISAPLAVRSIRQTLRGDLADQVEAATAHEAVEQAWLQKTADFAEGNSAMRDRREPNFKGE